MKKLISKNEIDDNLRGVVKEKKDPKHHDISEILTQSNYLSNFPKKKLKNHIQSYYTNENSKLNLNQQVKNPFKKAKISDSSAVKDKSPSPKKKKSFLTQFLQENTKQEKLNKEMIMKDNQKHEMNNRVVKLNLKFQKKYILNDLI
jgi:hypothetical protein